MTGPSWLHDLWEPMNGAWYERIDHSWQSLMGGVPVRLVQGGWPAPYQEVELPGGRLRLNSGHIHRGVLRRPYYIWNLSGRLLALVYLQDGELSFPSWLEAAQQAALHDWWDSIGRQSPQVRVIGLNALRLPREGELLYCHDDISRVVLEIIPWGDRWVMQINGNFVRHLAQWVTTPQEVAGRVEDWYREHLVRAPTLYRSTLMGDVWQAWKHRKVQWTVHQLVEYLGEWARQVER